MSGRGKGSKVPKKKEEKKDTGDFDERDAEVFKHLPDPEELTELLHATEDLLKAEVKRTKRRGKKG